MKNILLVDDEMIYLRSLSEGLRQINGEYNVMVAENGERALKILSSIKVDLLVTDLKMPVMDGFSLLVKVVKYFPYMHVIVATAFANSDVIKIINALGFSDYIEKPFEFDDLVEKIECLLSDNRHNVCFGVRDERKDVNDMTQLSREAL
ncbi:MAG: response regulator [Thermodesulfovibrionales bacterium]